MEIFLLVIGEVLIHSKSRTKHKLKWSRHGQRKAVENRQWVSTNIIRNDIWYHSDAINKLQIEMMTVNLSRKESTGFWKDEIVSTNEKKASSSSSIPHVNQQTDSLKKKSIFLFRRNIPHHRMMMIVSQIPCIWTPHDIQSIVILVASLKRRKMNKKTKKKFWSHIISTKWCSWVRSELENWLPFPRS